MYDNDKKKYHFEATTDLKTRIQEIFGKEFSENLFEVKIEKNEYSLYGFIGVPTFNKPSSHFQYFFVNNRFVKDKIFSYKARVRRMLDSTKSKLNKLKSEIDVKLAIRKLKNHRVRCTRQEYDDYINKLMIFRKDIINYSNETLDIVKHVEKMLTGSVSDSDVAYVNNKTDVLNDLNMKCLDRSNELSALKDNLNAEEGESSKTLAELGYTDSDLDRMIKTNEEFFHTFDLLDDSVRKLTELNNKLVAKAKQNGTQTTEDFKTVGFGAGIMLVGNIPTAVILTVGKLCGNAPLITNSWASAIALPFFIAGVIVAGLMSIGSVIVGGQVIAD